MRLVSLVLLHVAWWAFFLAQAAQGIEHKCSANHLVASQLWSRLEKEKRVEELDLTHRLNSKGERYGGKIAYKDSEIRYINLLEDLCDKLPTAYPLSLEDGEEPIWTQVDGTGKVGVLVQSLYPHKHAQLEIERVLQNHCSAVIYEDEDEIIEILRRDWDKKEKFIAAFLKQIAPQCPLATTRSRRYVRGTLHDEL